MKHIWPVLILVTLLSGQSAKNHLTITVIDQSGAPISNASVRLQHWQGNGNGQSRLAEDGVLTTDGQGRAVFESHPAAYDIFVSAQGFAPVAAWVDAKEEKEPGRTLKMSVRAGGGVTVEP